MAQKHIKLLNTVTITLILFTVAIHLLAAFLNSHKTTKEYFESSGSVLLVANIVKSLSVDKDAKDLILSDQQNDPRIYSLIIPDKLKLQVCSSILCSGSSKPYQMDSKIINLGSLIDINRKTQLFAKVVKEGFAETLSYKIIIDVPLIDSSGNPIVYSPNDLVELIKNPNTLKKYYFTNNVYMKENFSLYVDYPKSTGNPESWSSDPKTPDVILTTDQTLQLVLKK